MILDQYGRRVSRPMLVPEIMAAVGQHAAETLRNSIEFMREFRASSIVDSRGNPFQRATAIGNAVQVKMPYRFQQ
jgi:hypothetical protein